MTFETKQRLRDYLEEEGIFGYDDEIIRIAESDEKYLIKELKRKIESLERCIKKHTESAEKAEKENQLYRRGLATGWADAETRIKEWLEEQVTPWED